MEMSRRIAVLFLAICALTSAAIAPAFSGPPLYHEEGNVNYLGSYYESVYIEKSVGIDDYISVIDLALMSRAAITYYWEPWGVGWDLYNPDADINDDGVVNMRDISEASYNWGLNYHYSLFETEPGSAKVKANPPAKPVAVGEQFNVSIAIDAKREKINTYEFTLSWEPSLLEVVSVVGGGFISEEGASLVPITDDSYLYVGDTYSQPWAVSGKGILAIVTFECSGRGPVFLTLSSRLFDVDLHAVPHMDINGMIKQRL